MILNHVIISIEAQRIVRWRWKLYFKWKWSTLWKWKDDTETLEK